MGNITKAKMLVLWKASLVTVTFYMFIKEKLEVGRLGNLETSHLY